MFFRVPSLLLGIILFVVVLGATGLGIAAGRVLRRRRETWHEPLGVLQGALLGLVGLILAFSLSLAVDRYESRRGALVDEANAIGTTYLRAQTLPEPARSESMALLRRYTDLEIRLSHVRPGSPEQERVLRSSEQLQQQLWALAGQALHARPVESAPRLYTESLNETFDSQTTRVAGLSNRVPSAVLLIEVLGAAAGLAMLALFLTALGRGVVPIVLVAVFVSLLLLVTFDLDRPTRGLITVPATALEQTRAEMDLPPAAGP